MKNEVEQLAAWLYSEGIIAPWVDGQGNTQPAPTLQTRWLEETAVPSNERILFIRNSSAGGGDRFVTSPTITFVVLGTTTDAAVFPEFYANLIYNKLLEYTSGSAILAIDPLGKVNGPYKMESGRFAYDMEFTVLFESGLIL